MQKRSQDFTYSFPAVRGIQAGSEYYIAMCPLKLIPKIFQFDDEEVPPEYRAQRVINKARIPVITQYIVDNTDDYVFSSLTASIDGFVEFDSYNAQDHHQLGQLIVSMEAKFLINDGQHRRAAIEEALKIRPELGEETISIVFFHDVRLKRSQQMFSDLNKHAVNSTRSIGILYDFRDPLSMASKQVVQSNSFLHQYTDMESATLSMLSPKIFTLGSIYNTIRNLLKKSKGQTVESEEIDRAVLFWTVLCDSIHEWKLLKNRELTATKLRNNYIVGYSVFVEAMGLIGASLYHEFGDTSFSKIQEIEKLDWSKTNRVWIGRAMSNSGRITNNNDSVRLTSTYIKKLLDLPLNQEDIKCEQKINAEVISID